MDKNISYLLNLAIIFLAAIPSGIFYMLSGSTLAFYLKDCQFDNISIALFTLANFLHVFKFLWGPLLEQLVTYFDQKYVTGYGFKIALVISLACCIGCLYFLSIFSPMMQLSYFCLFLVGLSFFAASYEILIQASQILLLKQHEWGVSEAFCITGFRSGILLAGSLALSLSTTLPWSTIYQLLNYCCMIILVLLVLYPFKLASKNIDTSIDNFSFYNNSKAPFLALWQQPAISILIGFFITYRLQDHLLGRMPNMYLLDIGFSKTSIALIYKAYGLFALLFGGFVGGYLCKLVNFQKLFVLMLILHALTGLLFITFTPSQPNITLLYYVILAHEFTKGLMITPFFSYQLRCCEPRYAIPQIAFITSIVEFSRLIFGASAGYLATELGWSFFFILASCSSILCLYYIQYLPTLDNKPTTSVNIA